VIGCVLIVNWMNVVQVMFVFGFFFFYLSQVLLKLYELGLTSGCECFIFGVMGYTFFVWLWLFLVCFIM
jgi:hypothetical protein